MYAALIRASHSWRRVVLSQFELTQIDLRQGTRCRVHAETSATKVNRIPLPFIRQAEDLTTSDVRLSTSPRRTLLREYRAAVGTYLPYAAPHSVYPAHQTMRQRRLSGPAAREPFAFT